MVARILVTFILSLTMAVLGLPAQASACVMLPTNAPQASVEKTGAQVVWDNYPLMSVTKGEPLIDDGGYHLLALGPEFGAGAYYKYKITVEVTPDGIVHKKVWGWIIGGVCVAMVITAIYVVNKAADNANLASNSPVPPAAPGTNSPPGKPPPGRYGIWQALKDLFGVKSLGKKDLNSSDILFVREIKFTAREDISTKGYLDLNDPTNNGIGQYMEYRKGSLPLLGTRVGSATAPGTNYGIEMWFSTIGRYVKIYDGAGELVTATWIGNYTTNGWGTTNWPIPMSGYWLSTTNAAKFFTYPSSPVDTNFVDVNFN